MSKKIITHNNGIIETRETFYTEKTIQQLKQQLSEKDKEIEKLKQQYTILENENGKLTTDLIMDKYKKAQKEVSFGKQLAIAELEKVKEQLDKEIMIMSNFDEMKKQLKYLVEILVYIQQRIKELKGEKDVKD